MTTRPTADLVATELLGRLEKSDLKAIIKLEIEGDDASIVYVRANGDVQLAASIEPGEHPDIIITATPQSFEALLSGRMSFSDAFVSERVSIAGDVAKIVKLKQVLFPST